MRNCTLPWRGGVDVQVWRRPHCRVAIADRPPTCSFRCACADYPSDASATNFLGGRDFFRAHYVTLWDEMNLMNLDPAPPVSGAGPPSIWEEVPALAT
jgi:hypothetical protein